MPNKNQKFYVRTPEVTDKDGTFVRLFAETGESFLVDKKTLNAMENSVVIKTDTSTLNIQETGTYEVLKLKLPEMCAETMAWIWLTQPRYRPKDTIKGFLIIRERLNAYASAFRCRSDEGTLRLKTTGGKIIIARPISLKDVVTAFELPTTEHLETGDYTIQITSGKDAELATFPIEIAQFEKKQLFIQTSSPSWAMRGDPVNVNVTVSYFHGEPLRNGSVECSIVQCSGSTDVESTFTDHQTKLLTDGHCTFTFADLPVGEYSSTLTVTDADDHTETQNQCFTIADSPLSLQMILPNHLLRTKIPITFTLRAKDPIQSPIVDHPVRVTWEFLGKMTTAITESETYFTDAKGEIELKKNFDWEGTYKYRIETEERGQTISVVDSIVIERIVQGDFTIKNKLTNDKIHGRTSIKGTITIDGHEDTVKGIKYGYLDLITDRIVETKRIKLRGKETKYTLDGVVDFYGAFAVDFYINTKTQA